MNQNENLVPLADLCDVVPGGVRFSRLWRWAVVGVGGVRLAHTRIGGRIFSSRESVAQFLDRLNAPTGQTTPITDTALQAV